MKNNNWSNRHLNWSYLFGYTIPLFIVLMTVFIDEVLVFISFSLLYCIWFIVLNIWVLQKKGRSKAWVLMSIFIFRLTPLVLSNHNDNEQIERNEHAL